LRSTARSVGGTSSGVGLRRKRSVSRASRAPSVAASSASSEARSAKHESDTPACAVALTGVSTSALVRATADTAADCAGASRRSHSSAAR
jgi:hypothetical protein